MKLTREDVIEKLENNDKDFEGLNLKELDLSELDLSYANLENTNLCRANLCGANLENANLRYANLCKANLENANLSYSNLLYTYLLYADLRNANLTDIKGKKIDTFHYNKHFGSYCDGILKIGCESKTPTEWLEYYQELGKENDYTEQ